MFQQPGEIRSQIKKMLPVRQNTGQRWLVSERDASSFVIATGAPPEEDTRNNPAPAASGVNTITPSRFHVPPRPLGASHNTWGRPPDTWTFLSLPSAKNPMSLPSGDQNGSDAPSVRSKELVRRPPISYVQSTLLFACSE